MVNLSKLQTCLDFFNLLLGPFTKEFIVENYPVIREKLKSIDIFPGWGEDYLEYFHPILAMIFKDGKWNYYIGISIESEYYGLEDLDVEYILSHFFIAVDECGISLDVNPKQFLDKWNKWKWKEKKDLRTFEIEEEIKLKSNNVNEYVAQLSQIAKDYKPLSPFIVKGKIQIDDEFIERFGYYIRVKILVRPDLKFLKPLTQCLEKRFNEKHEFWPRVPYLNQLKSISSKEAYVLFNYGLRQYFDQIEQADVNDKITMLLEFYRHEEHIKLRTEESFKTILENVNSIKNLEKFIEFLEKIGNKVTFEELLWEKPIKFFSEASQKFLKRILKMPIHQRLYFASKFGPAFRTYLNQRFPRISWEEMEKLTSKVEKEVLESLDKEKPKTILQALLNLKKIPKHRTIRNHFIRKALEILLKNKPILEQLKPLDYITLIKNVITYSQYLDTKITENILKTADTTGNKLQKINLNDITKIVDKKDLLKHPWNQILPQQILNQTKTKLIEETKEKITKNIEQENYKKIIDLLKDLPEETADELAVNFAWPLLKQKINEKAKENPEEALKITDKILDNLPYGSEFKEFKKKLRNKRTSLQKRIEKLKNKK